MKRLNTNVGTFESTLEKRPEILKPVGVDAAFNIPLGMVNKLMEKLRSACPSTT